MSDQIVRTCVDCGEELSITVHRDKTYEGGHYFGTVEYEENQAHVEFEYWECDDCYAAIGELDDVDVEDEDEE